MDEKLTAAENIMFDKLSNNEEVTATEYYALLYDMCIGLSKLALQAEMKNHIEFAQTLREYALTILKVLEQYIVVDQKHEVLDGYEKLSNQDKVDVDKTVNKLMQLISNMDNE